MGQGTSVAASSRTAGESLLTWWVHFQQQWWMLKGAGFAFFLSIDAEKTKTKNIRQSNKTWRSGEKCVKLQIYLGSTNHFNSVYLPGPWLLGIVFKSGLTVRSRL